MSGSAWQTAQLSAKTCAPDGSGGASRASRVESAQARPTKKSMDRTMLARRRLRLMSRVCAGRSARAHVSPAALQGLRRERGNRPGAHSLEHGSSGAADVSGAREPSLHSACPEEAQGASGRGRVPPSAPIYKNANYGRGRKGSLKSLSPSAISRQSSDHGLSLVEINFAPGHLLPKHSHWSDRL